MTSTGKILIGAVVVIVLIGAGAWWWYSTQVADINTQAAVGTATSSMPSDMAGMNMGSTTSPAPATPSAAAANSAAALPSGSNDSDAALQQDTAAIDTQMNGLDSDNSNVSQSENAQ